MKTVNAALNILEAFLKQDGELGLMELAHCTELKPSTAHRLVNTLVKRDYLSQQQKGEKYSLSLKLLQFSNVIKKRMKVRNVAFPFLVELNTSVNEAVNLAVLDKDEAVYIEHLESNHSLRIFTQVGNRVPLHCTGVGKILLAHMKRKEFQRFFDTNGLPFRTENTMTDLGRLNKELATIRREGVARDNEEMELGVKCVAVPG